MKLFSGQVIEDRLVLGVLGPGGPQGRVCAGGAFPQVPCWDSVLAGTLLATAAEQMQGLDQASPQEGRHTYMVSWYNSITIRVCQLRHFISQWFN